MTVVLALEKVENPENAMATMRGYIQDEMYRQNVSLGGIRLAGLYKDEEISIQKLMYAVMIRDANRGCDDDRRLRRRRLGALLRRNDE